MKRSWQALLVVVVVGILAGAAIAGRPSLPSNDTRISAVEASEPAGDRSSTTAPTDDGASGSTAVDTGVPATTTAGATTAGATTTGPTTTEATTATVAATTTRATAPPSTLHVEPDRTAVRLVIANATDRSGVASETAERLRAIGYTRVLATDARNPRQDTVVFTRTGFESFAEQVAVDLGLGPERVQPLPETSITNNDASGDVVVAIATDLPE